jgi:hypothetical protein
MSGLTVNLTSSALKYISSSANGKRSICYVQNVGTLFTTGEVNSGSSWTLLTDLSSVITNAASLSYDGRYQSVSDVYGNVYVSSSYGAAGTWSQRYVNTTNTNFTPMPAKVAMSLDGKIQVATVFKNQITNTFSDYIFR